MGSSARQKKTSNVVAIESGGNVVKIDAASGIKTPIDPAKVQAIADRLDSENDGEEYSDPEYFDPTASEVLLGLSESNLKILWDELRLINDAAYIVFAVILDKKAGREFELYNFRYRWRGFIENKEGDVKELKPSTILAVTEKMEKQGLIERKKVKVSMEIEMKSILDEKTGQYQLPLG